MTSLRTAHARRAAWYAVTMNEPPHDDTESPMRRALRLKQAALAARPKGPGSAKGQRQQAAGVTAGASKPWMKKR